MIKEPASAIVEAIASAAARWTKHGYAERQRSIEAVSVRTGYTLSMVEYACDRLFGSLTRDAIEAVITDELGCLGVLDEFVDRPGRPRAHTLPAGRVCIISSRTTIGVAIVPAVFALCAKCDVLVKDREDRLATAFFATVADELETLRDAISVRTWTGESEAVELTGFDVVVAFGSDETLARIASRLTFSTRFIPFGSRASAGYVAREALQSRSAARRIAHCAASDLLLYETEGCLSLHVLFVERGGAVTAEEFGSIMAEAIRSEAADLQLEPLDERRAALLAGARDVAAFRANGDAYVYSDPEASYLVVVNPPGNDPPFFLPRALAIYSVEYPSQAAAYLEHHDIPLEALAVTSGRADLASLALRMRAARVATLGSLQSPQLGDFHGGRPRIAEFVRWIVDET